MILTKSYRFSDSMGEDLETHINQWEERTKSMKTREIKDRANKAKHQRKKKQENDKLLSSALILREDSIITACVENENEGEQSKVLQYASKRRRNRWFPFRDKLHVPFRETV
jgi:hypothetical protein